ncbi:MAG TPA: diguanylate cyclase [Elusimicrobiota bacterium]|nr:diguanylate cyclase [Elusimicrobiota bacterium]
MNDPTNNDFQDVQSLSDLADLEDRGHRLVEAMAGDVVLTERTKHLLDRFLEEKKESLYSDVIYYLTSERFPENQAKAMWDDILNHKFFISESMGRNVGVRVAAIDYLLNVRKLIHTPRVIKSSDFRKAVKLARTDALTGLYNRRYFIDQLKRVMEVASRIHQPVTLMMTDLDNFKTFNDKHGHQAGDLLLQEAGRLVRECVRASDVVARYGGDEMSLFLPRSTKMEAVPIAEKIRQQIEENLHEMDITISIGLAQYPDDATNKDDLIAAADEVLYRAKEFGGNKVSYFQPTRFKYSASGSTVEQVRLVGDFNNWNTRLHPMAWNAQEKEWQIDVTLKPGRYRYKFFVNNADWIPDPAAAEYENDGFGGQCSVVIVK